MQTPVLSAMPSHKEFGLAATRGIGLFVKKNKNTLFIEDESNTITMRISMDMMKSKQKKPKSQPECNIHIDSFYS